MSEYTIILEADAGGGFTVLVSALPGCITEGDTREQEIADVKEAISLYIESVEADGKPVPIDLPEPEVLKVAV